MRRLLPMLLLMPLAGADIAKDEAVKLLATRDQLPVGQAAALAQRIAAYQGPIAVQALAGLAVDQRMAVRTAAIEALAATPAEAAPWIDKLIAARPIYAKVAAIELASKLRGALAVDQIAKAAGDPEPRVRLAVAQSAATWPWPGATAKTATAQVNLLTKLFADQDQRVRLQAIPGLAAAKDLPRASDLLLAKLVADGEEPAGRTIEALLANGYSATTLSEGLLKALSMPQATPDLKALAADLLGRMGGVESVKPLLAALDGARGRAGEVRAGIADALGLIAPEDPALVAAIHKALLPQVGDTHPGARWAATWALMRTGSKDVVPAALTVLSKRPEDEPLYDMLRTYTGQTYPTIAQWATWWQSSGASWQPSRGTMTAKESSDIDFYDLRDATSNICYVFDVSGSMNEQQVPNKKQGGLRTKFDAASEELWRSVRRLEAGTRFSVVYFDSTVKRWDVGVVRASWRNKARFKDDLGLRAPGGATNAHDALLTGLDAHLVESVYFLSDGEPTTGLIVEPAKITPAIRDADLDRQAMARIHTVAFYIDPKEAKVAKEFMEALAKATGGGHRAVE